MQDAIGIIIIYTFGALSLLVPLYVVVQSCVNFVRASDGRGTIIIKALVALAVWAILTLICVMIVFMFVFEPITTNRVENERWFTILSFVITVIYAVVGLALSYWVRLQPGWQTLRRSRSTA